MTITTPWYNNHENLYTLAEWLRETHGWNFCKDNLLDVLETPWSWEKEWRLASGDVDFVEYRPENNPDNPHPVDVATCDWCDGPIGNYTINRGVSAAGADLGSVVEWLPVFEDTQSGLIACTDCKDSAREAVAS